jgi:PAS domain S-box-containing protein
LENANKALGESEKKYRELIDNANDAVVVVEPRGYLSFVNSKFCEMMGYSMDEVQKLRFSKLVHPDDLAIVTERFKKRLAGEEVSRNYEVRLLTRTGETIYVDVNSSTIEKEGKIVRILGIIRDISERKKAEEALRESEERHRSLTDDVLDSSAVGICILDSGFRIVWVNRALEHFFGLRKDEVIGKDQRHLIRERIKPIFEDPEVFAEKVLATYDNNTYVENFECHVLPDGEREERWLGHWSQPIRSGLYAGGRIEHYTDITERKRTEEQLLQAQKMEAVGRLAGGVAHDFNNLLTPIIGYSELLLRCLGHDDPICQDVEQIKRAGERAALLTRQLLAFSRKQVLQPEELDLNSVVTDIDKMLRRIIGEDIALVTRLAPELRRIRADRGQVEQVIMNLAVNSRDAMPEGGKLTIKTENVTLDEDYRRIGPEAWPGEFVCLSIEDTGIGIDKEAIEHIFEPFFSTKKSGTGLGLSVVYGIVKQHKGWINVYSEPGQGTTFKIYLPAISISIRPEEETKEISFSELQGSGQRILLVEDEAGVREFASRVLRENGYIVVEAATAEEALNIFEKEKGKFHLIFSDVVLPDKTGLQLVDQLLAVKPKLTVVMSSGYTDQKSLWPAIKERGFRFLQKPYSLTDLLRAVKETIEQAE